MIDPSKPMQTSCGWPVQLITVDPRLGYPIIAQTLVGKHKTEGDIYQWNMDGECKLTADSWPQFKDKFRLENIAD